MRVLQKKGAQKTKRFGVKLPISLAEKIEVLDKKVKEKGFVVDWSEPCIEVLNRMVSAVEADLSEAETT